MLYYRVSHPLLLSPYGSVKPFRIVHREHHYAIARRIDDLEDLDLQLLKLALGHVSFKGGVLNPVQVLLHDVVDLRKPLDGDIVRDNDVQGLPLASESVVPPLAQDMSHELERFDPDQSLVRDVPLQAGVVQCHGQSLFVLLEE